MAFGVAPGSALRRTRVGYLFIGLLLALASLVLQRISPPGLGRWFSLVPLPPAFWYYLQWQRRIHQARIRLVVGNRLSRLPNDFVVMHGLDIPAPWGSIEIDHLILSRFGVVVVGNGPSPGWMLERVEAIRSFLFSRGLVAPGFPIQPLVLLPPGVKNTAQAESNTPVVRVDHLTLEHLAPSRFAVFNPHQIRAIAQCLQGTRAAA